MSGHTVVAAGNASAGLAVGSRAGVLFDTGVGNAASTAGHGAARILAGGDGVLVLRGGDGGGGEGQDEGCDEELHFGILVLGELRYDDDGEFERVNWVSGKDRPAD